MNQEILYRYISGDATSNEIEQVVRWIDTDEENMQEYMALRKLYDISLWQTTGEKTGVKKKLISIRSIGYELLKIAAVFALVFTVNYFTQKTVDSNHPFVESMQTIYAPAGQRAEITLSDGTRVWLNAQSKLVFPTAFEDDIRQVHLTGEGYFDVTTDAERPFVVQTEEFNIKALGTQFNVYAYTTNTIFRTALIEGSVEVEQRNNHEKYILKPNDILHSEHGRLEIKPIINSDYFQWKEGLICFDDESIDDLFAKLELYFEVKITIKNKSILKNKYTGKFRTKDGIDHILKVLQLGVKFTYEKEDKGNVIIIK